jgi:presenilin-like A22 family membrane protease
MIGPLELSLRDAAILVAVFALFTFVIVRFGQVARLSLPVFLVVALVTGLRFVLSPWMPQPLDLLAALLSVLFVWRVPIVFVHDLAILGGIAGVAAMLGLSLTPLVACGLLSALSVYDIVSVYRTRHMVTLAGRMMTSGAVAGFLLPARFRDFFTRRDEAIRSRSVMLLGSGDIALPLMLAASAVSQSVTAAVCTALGAVAGLVAMVWLFSRQDRPSPMAALPPIAATAIAGYLVALIITS